MFPCTLIFTRYSFILLMFCFDLQLPEFVIQLAILQSYFSLSIPPITASDNQKHFQSPFPPTVAPNSCLPWFISSPNLHQFLNQSLLVTSDLPRHKCLHLPLPTPKSLPFSSSFLGKPVYKYTQSFSAPIPSPSTWPTPAAPSPSPATFST